MFTKLSDNWESHSGHVAVQFVQFGPLLQLEKVNAMITVIFYYVYLVKHHVLIMW